MQKVITINLGGNAYQLDESGYEVLRAYLDDARARLEHNPDRAEIIRDLERAFAEKCRRVLAPSRTVVSSNDINEMIREIGPIESEQDRSPAAGDAAPQPRRLYQIREGAMLSGVCNGVAAYFNIDPTLVRVGLVMAGIFEMMVADDPPVITVLTYVVLMLLVPYAKTPEQIAAGHGGAERVPYRIQMLVERVKAKFGALHTKPS